MAEISKINLLLRLADALTLLIATKASSDTSPRYVFCFRLIQKYTLSKNLKKVYSSLIALLRAKLSRKLAIKN